MNSYKLGDIIKYKGYDIYYVGPYKDETGRQACLAVSPVTSGKWNESLSHLPITYDSKMKDFYRDTTDIRSGFWVPVYKDTISNPELLYVYIKISNRAEKYSADYACVWLGSPYGANYAYYVNSSGVNYGYYRFHSYAVAPAFNLNKSFLDGDDDTEPSNQSLFGGLL